MRCVTLGILFVTLATSVWAASISTRATGQKMVCFYGSWAVYRPGNGKFDVENIDPFLCTHVIYSFVGLSQNNTIQVLDAWNDLPADYGKGAMQRFVGLKKINPQLTTLLAIGGWNEGSEKYSRMAADPAKRATFVKSAVEFIQAQGFDGLDLDWEYPGTRGGVPADKQNFVSLVRELKEAFAPRGWLVTAAVSAGKYTIDVAYDIPALAQYLDQLHLMSYDYHGGNWETATGINSPLYANPSYDKNDNLLLNTDWSVNYWISKGFPASKITLGMPLYAQGWTLANTANNGLYATSYNGINPGPYTQQTGIWGYNELCEKVKNDPAGWIIVRDGCYLTPYIYRNNQWLSYDDRESMLTKGQYVAAMGLGGSMVWSIETDDFKGLCGGVTFPLIKAIKEGMSVANPRLPANPCNPNVTTTTTGPVTTTASTTTTTTTASPVTAPASTTTTTTTTTTTRAPITTTTTTTSTSTAAPTTTTTTRNVTAPTTTTTSTTTTATPSTTTTTARTPSNTTGPTTADPLWVYCKKDGLNEDPHDCGKFYNCVSNGSGGWAVYSQRCAPGTVFSEIITGCTFPQNVAGCENYYNTK